MKATIKISTLILAVFLSVFMIPKLAPAQQANVSFQVFYDQLSPYGQWVDYPNYGYVWIPDAGPDFVPYSTGGYWVYTEYGWTWLSTYNWGWAPFHYGRWDYDDYYGWLWVPDTEWGPSWVNWRRADGYYGWEPMQPGISLTMSFGRDYDRNHDHWVFVRDRDFERSNINHYYVDQTVHNRIIVNSTVINTTYIDNSRHTTYVTGPARGDVQKATGRNVRPVAIQEYNKPGQNMKNGQLQMYRPQVQKNNGADHKPAPARIANRNEVKRPSERNTTNQSRSVSPVQNQKKEQQPNNVKPQNTNTRTQSSQPGNVAPATNNVKQQKQTQQQQMQQQQKQQPQKQQQQPQQKPKQQQQMQQQQKLQHQQQEPQQKPKLQQQTQQQVQQQVQQQQKQQQEPQQKPKQQQQMQRQQQQPKQQQQMQQQPKQQQQQPNTVKQQNSNTKAQPSQQKNATSPKNKANEQQPKNVKSSGEHKKEPPKVPELKM